VSVHETDAEARAAEHIRSVKHHIPATHEGRRRNVTITLCGDRRGRTPMHRVTMGGRDSDVRSRLDAELRPGVQRGESSLLVKVEETNPFKVELAFNNYQSPTVGAERGLITVTHQNITGHGDPLSVTYGHSKGIDVQIVNGEITGGIPIQVLADAAASSMPRFGSPSVEKAQFKAARRLSTSTPSIRGQPDESIDAKCRNISLK